MSQEKYSTDIPSSCRDYALHYATQLGWAVLPLHYPKDGRCSCGNAACKSPAKHPIAELAPNGSKDATTDAATIEQWFEAHPEANVGVATGAPSNLVVVDVDPRHGGLESLAALPEQPPQTVTARTGSGGYHFFYTRPDEAVKNSAGKLARGIDVRGEGGYVVAAPSRHMSGGAYEWTEAEAQIAPLGWIHGALKAAERAEREPNAPALGAEITIGSDLPQVPPVINDGERNERMIELAGYLRRKGFSERAMLACLEAENERLCKPPLGTRELAAIVRSAMRYAPAELLIDASDEPQEAEALAGDYSLGELFDTFFELGELIMHGLYRGELLQVNAIPDAGKSTLMLNASICLAVGRPFPPVVTYEGKPRRILYVDCENRPYRLQSDLQRMIRVLTPLERELVKDNLRVFVDLEIEGEMFSLTNPAHLTYLTRRAVAHRADLIVIDTLASASSLFDENNNAEVSRKILNPLKKVQKRANCAIALIDHKGKKGLEAVNGETAIYASRGASAKGGAARAVYNLDQPDPKGDPLKVVLTVAKVKGEKFEPVIMRLDRDSRWFSLTDETPTRQISTAEEIACFIREAGRQVSRAEVAGAFTSIPTSTLTRALKEAQRHGVKACGGGHYEAEAPATVLPFASHDAAEGGMQSTGTEGAGDAAI